MTRFPLKANSCWCIGRGIWCLGAVIFVFLMLGVGELGAEEDAPLLQPVLVDDFEAEPQGWKYIGGEEFPGAKGAFVQDTNVFHGGTHAMRLEADFSQGGAYIGVWRDLGPLNLPDFSEIRVWVKAINISRLGIRIVDKTGQCHQKNGGVALSQTDGWQELVLKVSNLVGGEHWGGTNDGRWHGPAMGIGLNISKDLMENPETKAVLWLDDLRVYVPVAGQQTILTCTPWPPACPPGLGTRIAYRWDAKKMGRDFKVFVHFIGPDGKIAFQGDHEPPISTRDWSGRIEYTNGVIVPAKIAEGDYRIIAGLYDPASKESDSRPVLKLGKGVLAVGTNGTEAEIGKLTVSVKARFPATPAPTLNLKGYHRTFNEDFSDGLSISPRGPNTRWIAHTPYDGDFGEAAFVNPGKDFPFLVTNGVLRIEARKFTEFGHIGKLWRSGLICSVDPKGDGFSQKFGYFEMRAKFPKGLGTWPAFWLLGLPQLQEPRDHKTKTQIEIDVVEQYGAHPNVLQTTTHLWRPDGTHWSIGDPSFVIGMTDDFHNYGVMVEDDYTTFYYDGVELSRRKTLSEAKVPLFILVDLALGGGWPIDETPNPSYLYVEHIRVYAKNPQPGIP